ncbi:SAICAR synthase-like protein [Xylariaceae sp. FL1019]|nr:SAICAR synthase-like protein [Xylariaceae sp. FL1019]
MPSFVNNENSPYTPSSAVFRLDSHSPHDPQFVKLVANEKPLPALIDHSNSNETFDDNASTLSTQSSEPRSRLYGDNMTTSLANGTTNVTATDSHVVNQVDGYADRHSHHSASIRPLDSHQSSVKPPSLDRISSETPHTPLANAFPSRPSTVVPEHDRVNNSENQRFSSPPSFPPASASTSALFPPPPSSTASKQRHTLEVPRVQPARSSKDGNDAAYASGRYSPAQTTGVAARRGSLSLARRNTRSMHSDIPRDEVPPDEDALRWAEAVRAKRASKKKRREEDDDDRVLVGTKVDENHANYTVAYNMLTGIRVSVSRTNAKLDRPLTDEDFGAKQKSTFDIAGNELVPSAKYDFKFKDYAPWVFRHLRALFRLDPADYLMSLTGKYILSELGSPGKSGSFFYFSRDYKYIIKTIHHAEHKFLRKILKDYYNHVADNPNTLLSQFYGLHRVKMPYGKKIHFVVMNNLFPPHRDIHTTFDLKGSTIGRDYREEELEKNPRATLKDLNWLRRQRHLEMGLQKKQLFLQQLQSDVKLLQKLKIMDYSLLVGMHDLRKGNEENLRDKTLQVFNPGGTGPGEDGADPNVVLMRTPSKLESARKARELRQMIKAERPVPMGETSEKMPDELAEGHGRGGLFYNDDGGLRATHEDGTAGDEVYYLGVIDCLTHYGMIKKIEHFWKGLSNDRTQISALPPQEYGNRFLRFMSGVTMSPEEAARDQRDREAAAAVAAAASAAESSSVPPVPTYLPPAPPGMRSPASPEPNPTVEKAMRKAMKKEHEVAKEDQVPERKITTSISVAMNGRTNSHTVLPVLEESAEAASLGGRSRVESESRPFTPVPKSRQDGFTDLGPHGIGGRGPPTPPKTSYFDPDGNYGGSRKRSGSGGGSLEGKVSRDLISRESLDKALPPLPK